MEKMTSSAADTLEEKTHTAYYFTRNIVYVLAPVLAVAVVGTTFILRSYSAESTSFSSSLRKISGASLDSSDLISVGKYSDSNDFLQAIVKKYNLSSYKQTKSNKKVSKLLSKAITKPKSVKSNGKKSTETEIAFMQIREGGDCSGSVTGGFLMATGKCLGAFATLCQDDGFYLMSYDDQYCSSDPIDSYFIPSGSCKVSGDESMSVGYSCISSSEYTAMPKSFPSGLDLNKMYTDTTSCLADTDPNDVNTLYAAEIAPVGQCYVDLNGVTSYELTSDLGIEGYDNSNCEGSSTSTGTLPSDCDSGDSINYSKWMFWS